MNIVLPVSPESIPLTSLQQSCLNCLRYFWLKKSLLKFEAIFCYYTTRGGSREGTREMLRMHSPISHFQHCFGWIIFFHNFEPLHNNMPKSPQARIIETVRTKCIIFGEAVKVRGQKYDKFSLKIVQKALIWPLQYANFQKFSWEHAPEPPWSRFCYLSCLKLNLSKKNYAWKVTNILVPPSKKILNTSQTWKHFQKAIYARFRI